MKNSGVEVAPDAKSEHALGLGSVFVKKSCYVHELGPILVKSFILWRNFLARVEKRMGTLQYVRNLIVEWRRWK